MGVDRLRLAHSDWLRGILGAWFASQALPIKASRRGGGGAASSSPFKYCTWEHWRIVHPFSSPFNTFCNFVKCFFLFFFFFILVQRGRRIAASLALACVIMMSMNSKQPFSMHPILHEPKYTPLHSSSEAIRRACLPTPSVSPTLHQKDEKKKKKDQRMNNSALIKQAKTPPPQKKMHISNARVRYASSILQKNKIKCVSSHQCNLILLIKCIFFIFECHSYLRSRWSRFIV